MVTEIKASKQGESIHPLPLRLLSRDRINTGEAASGKTNCGGGGRSVHLFFKVL